MRGGARKSILGALALVAAIGLSACGSSHTRVTTGTYAGESGAAAPYLNVGPLIYQVQISRALNPFMQEDESYLEGIPAEEQAPAPGEQWLGVFIQVYNQTDTPHSATTNITITDTEGKVYQPTPLPPSNLFAYRGGEVKPGGGQLPVPGSIAYDGPTQGALVLYKIKLASLDARPLTIKIVDMETGEKASAILDV